MVTALSIISLTALYLYSLSIGPAAFAIGDLNEGFVGQWVETVGEVKEVRLTSSGLWLLLVDPLDYAEIAAFARLDVYEGFQNKEAIDPGAEVMVRGELQTYRGDLEILITSAADLRVLGEVGQ